ncbi:MAG: hypothetical protein AB7F75_06110 [Planctomycetota bacterium]
MTSGTTADSRRFTRGFALLFFLVMLGLALVSLTSDLEVLYLKRFVDFIAAGRSTFKVYFFFFFMMVMGLSWLRPTDRVPSRSLVGWVLGLMAATYVFGFLEHFGLAYLYGFDPHGPNIFFADGIQSQTTSYHNHVGKVVLSGLLSLIPGSPLAQRMDYGYPFLLYLPGWLVTVHAILFLGMFLNVIILLARSANDRSLPTPWYFIMIFSGFSMTKNSLDGGLLNSEVMVSAPLFLACCHFLTLVHPRRAGTPATLWLTYGIPISLLYMMTFPLSDSIPTWMMADSFKLNAVRLATVYGAVYGVSLLATSGRPILSVMAFMVFVVVHMHPSNVLGLGALSSTNLGYALETLGSGQRCYACVLRQDVQSDDRIEIISSVPTARHQIIQFKAKSELKIHEIRNIKLILHHYEIHRLGVVNPRIYPGRLKAQLIIPGSQGGVHVDPSIPVPGVGEHGLRSVGGDRYILEMTLSPPTSMFSDILADYLFQLGLNRVILTSLEVS